MQSWAAKISLLVLFAGSATAQAVESVECVSIGKGFVAGQGVISDVLDINADEVNLALDHISVFSGDVKVTHNGQVLTTDRATYNKETGLVTARGNVVSRDDSLRLEADSGTWSVGNEQGSANNADYFLRESGARGHASVIKRKGDVRTDLFDASYTTCPESSDAWQLQAKTVNLNHETAIGTARNVTLKLGGWPVLFTPYLSLPLDDARKSGLLAPTIGNSNKTGFDLRTPYYWNISPNHDATIAPRWMSERGLMLEGEYRYLFSSNRGSLKGAFLSGDDLTANGVDINPYVGEDRKQFSWQHTAQFGRGWHGTVDYNYASDAAYLEDFGNNLSLASTTHLNRMARVNYNSTHWNIMGQVQAYQTLGTTRAPYHRRPQLVVRGHYPNKVAGLDYDVRAEYVDFGHDALVTGQRLDIEPAISLPWQSTYAFVKPRLAVRHTRYALDDVARAGLLASQDAPTRTMPIVSVDSGLFFERNLKWRGKNLIQTLEPRAFYLYVPDRDQNNIPLFDSSRYTFGTGQLFSHNRFVGGDRVGDANQIALGLTSRFVDEKTGREHLRISVGQIRYFKDRTVRLRGTTVLNERESEVVAEVSARLVDNWRMRGQLQWSPIDHQTELGTVSLEYRGDNGKLFNLTHRYRRAGAGLEQADVSLSWPINNKWRFVGRWYHSLQDNKTLETLAGLEYDSCCWATRFIVRDYINDVTEVERNLAFFVQLELKGLGGIGKRAEKVLQRSILGYQ